MARYSLLLLLALFILSAKADLLKSPPHEAPSFNPQNYYFQEKRGPSCRYAVKIKTSCFSPKYTTDAVTITFGDLYHNEVLQERIDYSSADSFERCSTDTFQFSGPCGFGVCYLYLYRYGSNGWTPGSVEIYEHFSGQTTSFYYGVPVPYGVWFGFDECSSTRVRVNYIAEDAK